MEPKNLYYNKSRYKYIDYITRTKFSRFDNMMVHAISINLDRERKNSTEYYGVDSLSFYIKIPLYFIELYGIVKV